MRIRPALLLLLSIGPAGCSSYYTKEIQLTDTDSRPTAVAMDIRQRVILSGWRSEKVKSDGSEVIEAGPIICAEPSPDAMSAVSSSLSAALEVAPEQTLDLANSFNEAAAFTGLRTQTIQLLRDGMYRLCEGYLAGALSKYQYQWQMRRYQRNMVGILAIESLTSALRAPSVTLSAQSSASIGQSIVELEEQLVNTETRLAELTKSVSEQDDAAQKAKLQSEIDRLRKTESAIQDAIARGQSSLASGETTAKFQSISVANTSSQTTIDSNEIAGVINKIIDNIYEPNDFEGLCLEAYLYSNGTDLQLVNSICKMVNSGTSSDDRFVIKNRKEFQEKVCNQNMAATLVVLGKERMLELCES